MVHHAGAEETPGRSLLPRSTLVRAAALSVTGAVAAVAVLGLYLFGGLESAVASAEPSPAGTELRNILYTVTPHEARVVSDDLGTSVRVRADLELHGHDEPIPVFDVGTTTLAHVQPGDTQMKYPEMEFVRNPGALVFDVQPHMPEEVVLSWPLPDGVSPDEVDTVRITVHQTDKILGTGGAGVLWVKNSAVIGVVDLPVEGA